MCMPARSFEMNTLIIITVLVITVSQIIKQRKGCTTFPSLFLQQMEAKKEGVVGHDQIHITNQQHSWKEARPFLWWPIHGRSLA